MSNLREEPSSLQSLQYGIPYSPSQPPPLPYPNDGQYVVQAIVALYLVRGILDDPVRREAIDNATLGHLEDISSEVSSLFASLERRDRRFEPDRPASPVAGRSTWGT